MRARRSSFIVNQEHQIFGLLAGLVARLLRGLGAALLRTFAARGVASVGSFVLVVVIGRLYGTAGLGVFALALSLLTAAALLARYGMDNALMRFAGRDLASPFVCAYLRYAVVRSLCASIVAAVVIYLSRDVWATLFHAPGLPSVLIGIAVATPAFTLCYVFAGFLKSVRRPATASLLLQGGVALIAAAIIFALRRWPFMGDGLATVGFAYALSAWILAIAGACLCFRWSISRSLWRAESTGKPEYVAFRSSSAAFFAGGVATFVLGILAMWIVGYLLSNSDVGLFKAARQIAMLIGVILLVLNAVLPPRFAQLYHNGQYVKLAQLAKHGSVVGLLLAAVPVTACLLFPSDVLRVVGHDFPGAATALRILAVGQLVAVGCGSVGHILNMTAHEALQRNIAWGANGIGVLAILGMAPWLGVSGAAAGVALGIVIRKFVGMYFVWRQLGIWTVPLPNVLKLIGVEGASCASK